MVIRSGRSENAVNAVWRLLVRLALIVGVAYAYYRLRAVVTTLFVAAIMAYVLDPTVEWLSRRPGFVTLHNALARYGANFQAHYRRLIWKKTELPATKTRMRRHTLRVFATLYIFTLSVFVLWHGTRFVLTPFVKEFQGTFSPEGQKRIKENKEKLLVWYNKTVPDWARSDKLQKQILNSNAAQSVQKMVTDVGGKVLENVKYVVELALLPVLAFYFLIDGRTLKHEFVALLPRSRLKETLRCLHEFNLIMRAFIAGQFLLCALAGLVVGVGLAALGVQYPMILGVLAGITRAIPIIGPIVGGIPIILLTLISKGLPTALLVLGFFTFLHFAESKFIMPLLIGDRMELHPVIIIVVLIVGGELGGIIIGGQLGALLGMFFAAPIASILRFMVRRYWLHLRPRPPHSDHSLPVSATLKRIPARMPETID